MAAKTDKPQKRGPKPKDGPKVAQLTVRLRPSQRLALEIVSRDRNLSMSQTMEFALARLFRTWHIDNKTVSDYVSDIIVDGKKEVSPQQVEEAAERTLNSEALLILRLPESLRRPDEEYFASIVRSLGKEYLDNLDELWSIARDAYRDDLNIGEVLVIWKEMKERGMV